MTVWDFLLENWLEIVLGIATVVCAVIAYFKNKKAGKEVTFLDTLQTYIQKAENLSENAATKKELVAAWARQLVNSLGLKYTDEELNTKIDEQVAFTKTVNAREKDKVAAAEVLPNSNENTENSVENTSVSTTNC